MSQELSNDNSITYKYNSDGIRTQKRVFDDVASAYITHDYMLDGTKILSETVTDNAYYNSYTLYYVYDASGSITGLHYNNQPYYFQKNIQGDILRILDRTGTAVVEYTYDAWGNILSVTGSMASTLGQYNPFRYRGYYYDSETEWYYLNSRYYDPEIGRFINADAFIGANGGLQGYNMFAYCNNNPVMFYDPSGCMGEIIEEDFDYQDPFDLFPECMDGGCGTSYYDYLLDSAYRNYLVRSNCAAYDASRGGYHSSNVSSAYNNPFDYIVPGAVSVTDDMAVSSAHQSSQDVSQELTDEQLRSFGQPGDNNGFRVINGTHDDAINFTESQTQGLTEYAPGKYVGYNSRGVEFRVYPRCGYNYSSIRINGVKGLKGIKVAWGE